MRHEDFIRQDPNTLTKKSLIEAMQGRKAMTAGGKYIDADCFNFRLWTKEEMMKHLINSEPIEEGITCWQ